MSALGGLSWPDVWQAFGIVWTEGLQVQAAMLVVAPVLGFVMDFGMRRPCYEVTR